MACSAPAVYVGTVNGQPFFLSDNDFDKAQAILAVSGDQGDPTLDEYTENIAGGNNDTGQPWVLRRVTDYDGTPTTEIIAGSIAKVADQDITTQYWKQTNTGTGISSTIPTYSYIIAGTDNINFEIVVTPAADAVIEIHKCDTATNSKLPPCISSSMTLTSTTNIKFVTDNMPSGYIIGTRVLVKNELDAKNNGIYEVIQLGASACSGVQLAATPGGKPPKQTSLPGAITVASTAVNTKPPPGGNGIATTAELWTPGDYDAVLSTNYRLSVFTVKALFPWPLTNYDTTYTAQRRFEHLTALAVNCVEPMRAKFGKLRINSGIRNKTSTASGLSQHITGQACDIQFEGWTYAQYWDAAQWVKDNIPFDQFIFEHSSATGLAWFHLSFNKSGNRASSDRTKVMTMYRNKYDPGLKRYG